MGIDRVSVNDVQPTSTSRGLETGGLPSRISRATRGPEHEIVQVREHDQGGEQRHLHGEDGLGARAAVGQEMRRQRRAGATMTSSAPQPIGRQRSPSPRNAAARGSPVSVRMAGTAMNVSAIVPPTQTVAPSTCRTTSVISSQCGTAPSLHENRRGGARGLEPQARRGGPAVRGRSRTAFSSPRSLGLAPGRALDLACGSGRNAVWLAEQGWTVTGVDFSDVALEQARGLAAERGVEVEWLDADLREWVPDPGAFDLVVVLYLQLPAEELDPICRPGGRRGRSRRDAARRRPPLGQPRARLGRPAGSACALHRRGRRRGLDGLEIEKAEARAAPGRGRARRDRRARAGPATVMPSSSFAATR